MATFTYTVVVEAPTRDEANTVMVERVYHVMDVDDEDYGFKYSIDVDWDRTVEAVPTPTHTCVGCFLPMPGEHARGCPTGQNGPPNYD